MPVTKYGKNKKIAVKILKFQLALYPKLLARAVGIVVCLHLVWVLWVFKIISEDCAQLLIEG